MLLSLGRRIKKQWLWCNLYFGDFLGVIFRPLLNNFISYIFQEIYLSIYWLAMSNSMYNPMIYCVMNNR